jgi:hypothetical protein
MADETKDDVVEDIKEMTPEERAEAWAKWVRSEVNSALDIYLDKAISGNINVRYYPHVIEVQEGGPVTDDTKADGVLLSIVFEFEEPIDLQKPRIEDDAEE